MSDLSPKQVAARMGVSLSLIYREIDRGNLTAYRSGNRLRVTMEALDSYRERNAVRARDGRPAFEPPPPQSRQPGEAGSFVADLKATRGRAA